MSLINRCINIPSHDNNQQSFTQILNYHSCKHNPKMRNSEDLERENTIYSSLPTICENSQYNKKKVVDGVDTIDGKWPKTCHPSDVCLPPLSKELASRKVKHDFILPNLQRRPSTPRPVLLLHGNRKLSSSDLEHQNAAKLDENSNTFLQVSKIDDGDWHPLFSVSPNGLERSSPDTDIPRSSCINIKQSITYPDTSKKSLLKRGKIRSCELRHTSNGQFVSSVLSRKLIGNVGHLKKQIKDNDYREHPPNRSSTHLPNDGNRIAPAATSSPYEERSLQELSLPPQEVSSQTEQGDEISTHRKRAKKSTRATPSDRSVLEGRSDGRRSSVKSASRLSRTRPKQYNYSSSEESYPAHRPERLNSSVYSEQDKVPSLVNLPKSNAFLSRHRPNTAESNLDSGFVGSEGTLKSQDLSNSVNHARPRPSRRGPVTKPDAGKEQPTGTKFNGSSPYPEIANDAVEGRSKERQRHPSTRETPVDRMSASVGNPRMQSRDKNIPESHETSRISSKLNQPFTRVQEVGRRTSTLDDITSVHTSPETQTDASFRRLPVTTERSPFDSSVPVIDLEDSPVKRVRQPRDAERYRRSTLSPISKGSDPQRLVLHSKGDRRSWRSDSRRHLISSATSGDRLPAGGLHSYDEDSISDKAIEPRKQKRERIPPRFNESSHSTNGSRPSEYADRLHKDLQLLRDQLSRLNQTHIQDNHAKRLRNTNEHIVSPAITGDRTYDDIKQKLDGLNGQLQKSLHQLKERSSPERGYKPNRDYQELKDKIDQLTVELQRTQEYVFDSKESLDQFATPPSRSLPGFRRSQPATQEQLFTLQGPTQEHFDTDQYSRPIYTKQPKPSRTYVDPQELQAMPLRSSHTQPAVMESSPTYITVCPVCSDIGYHKHGDYVFQGRPVPMHQTAFQTSLSPAKVVASTPNRPVQNMHPLDFSPTHQMPSTIHHIHTIHKSRKSTVMSSSSESQSDNEEDRRRKRRRNRSSNVSNRARSASKARDRLANRRLDEFNDWRLSESLDEAARAASNMQIASRRMLNSLAADLIKSGYS